MLQTTDYYNIAAGYIHVLASAGPCSKPIEFLPTNLFNFWLSERGGGREVKGQGKHGVHIDTSIYGVHVYLVKGGGGREVKGQGKHGVHLCIPAVR